MNNHRERYRCTLDAYANTRPHPVTRNTPIHAEYTQRKGLSFCRCLDLLLFTRRRERRKHPSCYPVHAETQTPIVFSCSRGDANTHRVLVFTRRCKGLSCSRGDAKASPVHAEMQRPLLFTRRRHRSLTVPPNPVPRM